jgi:hypothetical protein
MKINDELRAAKAEVERLRAERAEPPRCDGCAESGIESLSHCSECGDPL